MMEPHLYIKEMLVNLGLVSHEVLEEIIGLQRSNQRPIEALLLERGIIQNRQAAKKLLPQLGIHLTKHIELVASDPLREKFSREFAVSHRVCPVAVEGGVLTLVSDSPFTLLVTEFFEQKLGGRVNTLIVETDLFERLVHELYGNGAALDKAQDAAAPPPPADTGQTLGDIDINQIGDGDDDAPIIRLVSLIIQQGSRNRASDIHIESLEDKLRIRYRIDGVLHEVPGPPKRLQGAIISRIKIMAGMNIAEKRLPQDGRIKIAVDEKELDLRVSTLPAMHGESVVMRILDKSAFMLKLDDMGFAAADKEEFERLIQMPNGIFLVTGPTGSGKTTTLYAALSCINTPEKKLITVEDPVEYQLEGINQVQVKPQIGLTFAGGLRSMLRQAPDVILVGEIRDYETASIAIQAALTGHLILSTLHTNDAPSAVTRLIDMGIKPYLVASTVQAVLAQRLVRRICDNCKKEYAPLPDEIAALEEASEGNLPSVLYRGSGCVRCNNTGYRGRVGIFELFRLSPGLRQMVFDHRPSSELRRQALTEKMRSLRAHGMLKAIDGITTVHEVLRATQSDMS
ncbi:MAG: Flp pilus assembly complex ATPase component TadA [Candidatus Omnitrophica bacterium]|nr:Flp pilus assembly complex ATPase component TadA [Candidatus Omnitrophota bacterium]